MTGYLLNSGSPSIFSITSATNNVSGGQVASSANVVYIGYVTNRFFGNTASETDTVKRFDCHSAERIK